ncbi:unnamed protein product [Rhizophagus irregularis]|nr:unnamed protein product [Rhizophagus irregularis]CAB5207608.1 unnamed protein product [Rhizophagus irregularis]
MLNFVAYCNGIYGVTRDPHNNEYAIVMKYQNLGNMREFIKKGHILNWKLIVKILHNISYGLSTIHRENWYHGDFHTGNILLEGYGNYIGSVISDFGFCRPVDQSRVNKIIGVLPFIAPEVLRGGEFTKAADVYGFGMVMSEIICGNVPFADRDYDLHLAIDICNGERPPISEYTPDPYAALMKRCWDSIPTNRPTAQELYRQIGDWYAIICKFELNDDIQLSKKLEIEEEFSKEREDRWKARLSKLTINPYPLKHSQNFLTSKQLEYSKQLTTQLIDIKPYYTRQFDMSLCLSTRI